MMLRLPSTINMINIVQIKIFVRVCFWYASNGYLNLDNGELICLYKECLAMAYNLKDIELQINGCAMIGELYKSMYQYTEAIQYHERCLQIATKEGEERGAAAAYCDLGTVHELLAKYHKAINLYEKALDIALMIGEKKLEGKAYSNLGSVCYLLTKYDEAIHYLKRSLEITVEEGDKKIEGAANRDLGLTYIALGKYHEAIDCHEKTRKIAVEIGDKNMEGAVYNNLGFAYYLLDRYDNAIMYAKKSLKIATDRKVEQQSYALFGAICYSLGNFNKSIKYHKKCLNIAIEVGDKRVKGEAYRGLGRAYLSLCEYDKSIENLKTSLCIALGIGKRDQEAAAYGNLGIVYDLLGEHHKAIEYNEKNLKISKEIGDKCGEGKTNGNLGISYRSLGKYNKAIKYFENSLQIATDIGNKKGQGCAYGNFATSYAAVGKYDDAIKYNEKHLEIAIESGDKNGEGIVYLNLGSAYLRLRKYTDSIMYLEKSKIIFTETGDKDNEALVYINLGTVYDDFLGKYHESIKYHEKGLHIAIKIGSKRIEGEAYFGLGGTNASLGKYHEAKKYYEKCLKIALETGIKKMEATSNYNLGYLYMELPNSHNNYSRHNEEEYLNCLSKAEGYLTDAVICYEWLFDHLQDQDQLKISIVDTYIKTHKLFTSVLIKSLKSDEALLMSERGRACALGDLLMLKYGMTRGNDTINNYLTNADIETILSNSTFCVFFFAMASDTNVVTWHLSHCSKSHHIEPIEGFNSTAHESPFEKDQEDRAEAYLNQVVKASYDNMKVREGMNCEDRSLLANDHDDVVNAKGQSFVQGERSETTENDHPKKITQNPEADRCIPDEDLDNIDPLQILFDGLLANVKCSDCRQDELVIVPFGPLYTVPFAALRDPNTGLFLSETKRIRLAPSLTTLKALQESSVDYHSKTGALIIGNPHVGEVMFRGKKNQFHNLPGAEKEAKMISKLLGVKPFIGPQATKEVIIQSLQESVAVIHFAAHGTPEGGEIALTPCVTSGIPEEEDYILTIKEVQESGVRPQLVVLSCCHSGRGEIKAEGVVGMSRAFLAAGARAVVASLWAIEDEATMVFMEKFYTHLSRGESASLSLQQTMREMRETDRYSEPKYWAPFFLIGDDVTISCGGHGS